MNIENKSKQIKIVCLNNNSIKEYPIGTYLTEIIKDQQITLKFPILGARVNNEIEELSYTIYKPKVIEFFDYSNIDGLRMYIRSLSFVFIKAVKELFPQSVPKIPHSLSKGFYCEIENLSEKMNADLVSDIENKMRDLIESDIPFKHVELLTHEAIELFIENGYLDKARLFKQCPELYTSVYYLRDYVDYFYGYLVPSTGYLKVFDLMSFKSGLILRIPSQPNPKELLKGPDQPKMYEIFKEYKNWGKIIGAADVGSINEMVLRGEESELIKISEALHEKKVAQIADQIKARQTAKFVLISGPSSSGKTTFSKRLAIQLKVAGLMPTQISMDNYFVDRDKTPKDENGEYDFESFDAIDLELFNQNCQDLLDGKEVELPEFSFQAGKRIYDGRKIQIEKNTIIIIEGIHALNPRLTNALDQESIYKIYVSALTQVSIDSHNRIPTTDNRLIRRIIRDFQYRGYTALETLRRWPSVRKGEDKNIFPFQEECDIMFNSALPYELGVLKRYAEPLLKDIKQIEPEFSEVMRLLKFLSYFKPMHETEVPPTSILREFLSGSSFRY